MADPEAPTIGASVLGMASRRTWRREAHERGGRAAAAERYHAGLAEERARTEAVARNIFAPCPWGLLEDDDDTGPGGSAGKS